MVIECQHIHLMWLANGVGGENDAAHKRSVIARHTRYTLIGEQATLQFPPTRTVGSRSHTLLKQCIHLGNTGQGHRLYRGLQQSGKCIASQAQHRPTAHGIAKLRGSIFAFLVDVTQCAGRCIDGMKNVRSGILARLVVVITTTCCHHTC